MLIIYVCVCMCVCLLRVCIYVCRPYCVFGLEYLSEALSLVCGSVCVFYLPDCVSLYCWVVCGWCVCLWFKRRCLMFVIMGTLQPYILMFVFLYNIFKVRAQYLLQLCANIFISVEVLKHVFLTLQFG